MVLNHKGRNNPNSSFDWSDALVDAGIIGGLTFFSSLGGLGVTGLLTGPEGWLAAAIAAGTQFFLTLAIKRGLREKG